MAEKKPYTRPTRQQQQDQIELTRKLIAQGQSKGDIKRALYAAYNVSPRTVERYLARAREFLLAESQRPQPEHRSESLAFYHQILTDKDATPIVKLKARERIDKLLALELPQKLTFTDPTGDNPLTIRLEASTMESLPDDELQKLAAAYEVIERLRDQEQMPSS